MDFSEPLKARILRVATGGVLTDRGLAAMRGEQLVPPVPVAVPEIFVLDLGSDEFSIGALQALLLPVGERVRNGFYGPVKLMVATQDPGAAMFIDYLADRHNLAIFIASGTSHEDLRDARPAGSLTPTELVTLDAILASEGPGVNASSLAQRFGIELTAAGNRLVNLEKRGFVYRVRQPGREGDRFIDPRSANPTVDH